MVFIDCVYTVCWRVSQKFFLISNKKLINVYIYWLYQAVNRPGLKAGQLPHFVRCLRNEWNRPSMVSYASTFYKDTVLFTRLK